MPKRIDRSILPESLRGVIPDDMTDREVLLYASAYQRGQEDALAERISALAQAVAEIRQEVRELGVAVPASVPRAISPTSQIQVEGVNPPAVGQTAPRKIGQPIDLDAARQEAALGGQGREAQAGTPPAGDVEGIGPFPADYVAEVFAWTERVVGPAKAPAALALVRHTLEEWAQTHREPPEYRRMLVQLFEKKKLLPEQSERLPPVT